MHKSPRRVTVDDVATAVKLSVPAVYQALNGGGRLPEATRERVRAAARRLGFRINRAAATVKRGRHDVIALLVGNPHMVRQTMVFSLASAAQKVGYSLLIDMVMPQMGSHVLQHDCADGVVVFEDLPERVVKRIIATGLPLIRVNTNVREGDGVITYDDERAVEEGLQYLAGRGRRHPVLLMPDTATGHYTERLRPAVFQRVAGALGMSVRPPVPMSFGLVEQMVEGMLARMEAFRGVDAFVLYDDRFAAGLVEACRMRGWKLPEAASMLTLGSTHWGRMVYPPLIAMEIGQEQITQAVLHAVLHAIKHLELPPCRKLRYALVDRSR